MKKYMKAVILLLMLGMVNGCFAQSETASYHEWMNEGNTAYNDGDFELAVAKYNQVMEAGLESAPLYFNTGNAYYKMKDFPHAILFYEKALKLDPGNEDIRTNLEIANKAVVDKIEQLPQSFIARWWDSLKTLFPVDGWAWVSVIAFALVLLSLFAFLMSRRMGLRKAGFFAGILFIVVLALSLFFAIQNYQDARHKDEAIVMTSTVMVKSSPSVSSVDLFVLHEGAKVRILDANEEWNKIKIANGSVGWIQIKDIAAF